jgi:anhydro-N-acetylmuramic acid kinase
VGGTGARTASILGAITPGAGPLVLPEPIARIDSLRMLTGGPVR